MPKASPIQYAFDGGQLGPRLQGRADLAKYATGCNVLQNFIPTVQGPLIKRSGTRFVKEAKDSSTASRLIPFEFSREQAYILEFGNLYMRVYRDGGAVLETAQSFTSAPTAANPVVCTDTAHPFVNGDQVYITGSAMTRLNGRYFTVANKTTNDYELSGEDGTGRTTGTGGTAARVYEIATVYTAAQVNGIQPRQNADVLFLAHPDQPPQKIERTSDTAWTATAIAFSEPAFRPENLDKDLTVSVNAETGTAITCTASAALFTSDMIGGYFKISELPPVQHPVWRPERGLSAWALGGLHLNEFAYYENNVYKLKTVPGGPTSGSDPPVHLKGTEYDSICSWEFMHGGYGYGKITAVASSTSCTVDVDTDGIRFPLSTVLGAGLASGKIAIATDLWSMGAWSVEHGYPRSVAFYEDRLWWAGTMKDPQTFWGSRTGEYEDFELVAAEAASGLLFTLATDKVNAIEWMSGEDVLLIGTRGGEFTADSGSADAAITPSNIRVRRRSNYGSASDVQPVVVDSALLFVQRSGKRIHDLVYAFSSDSYVAPDLTELSYDILQSGVVELAYQASPFRLLWAALADGSLASLVYVRDQDVIGWGKHAIGGTSALVESVAVIPHPDEDEDQLWMLVNRTVNGATVRHIEYLEKPFEIDDLKADAFFVDAGLTYSGASTTTLTGLDHLEGETVHVLGDGTVMNDATVSGGSITLEAAVTKAQVGLALPAAKVQTMRLDAGMDKIGTAQGRKGRIHQLVIRLDQTGDGLFYGSDFTTLDEWHVRDTDDAMDTPVPLFTGDTPSLEMPGGYDREKRVAVSHALPLPCTIISFMPQLTTEPR